MPSSRQYMCRSITCTSFTTASDNESREWTVHVKLPVYGHVFAAAQPVESILQYYQSARLRHTRLLPHPSSDRSHTLWLVFGVGRAPLATNVSAFGQFFRLSCTNLCQILDVVVQLSSELSLSLLRLFPYIGCRACQLSSTARVECFLHDKLISSVPP